MRRTVTFHDFCAPSPFSKTILCILYNTFCRLSSILLYFYKNIRPGGFLVSAAGPAPRWRARHGEGAGRVLSRRCPVFRGGALHQQPFGARRSLFTGGGAEDRCAPRVPEPRLSRKLRHYLFKLCKCRAYFPCRPPTAGRAGAKHCRSLL